MNAYVWEDVYQLTSNYHSGGGLMVVAEDETQVRALVASAEDADIRLTEEEWQAVIVYPLQGDPDPRVFVFPDAGCC